MIRLAQNITFLLLLFVSILAQAQDPHYTQYHSNSVHLNPAFAGFEGCSRIVTTYRNQWGSSSQWGSFSYDQYVKPLHGGVALKYEYDPTNGTLKTHSVSGVYAPTFKLFSDKLVVSSAIEAGWTRTTLDWDLLTFNDMIDPRFGFVYPTNSSPPSNTSSDIFDLDFGILLSHHGLVYGVSLNHITEPNNGFSGVSTLPMKITAHIAYNLKATEKLKFTPSFLFQKQQDFIQMNPTISAKAFGATLGVGGRFSDDEMSAVLLLAGYEFRFVRLGYSIDIGTNLTGLPLTHELNLAFRFNCRNKQDYKRAINMAWF